MNFTQIFTIVRILAVTICTNKNRSQVAINSTPWAACLSDQQSCEECGHVYAVYREHVTWPCNVLSERRNLFELCQKVLCGGCMRLQKAASSNMATWHCSKCYTSRLKYCSRCDVRELHWRDGTNLWPCRPCWVPRMSPSPSMRPTTV